MKKQLLIWILSAGFALFPSAKINAQIPILDIIKAGITKVIKAVDLKIQRLQNQTVWLQSAQKVIENTMSELHLNEITGWVQNQKDLYSNFYTGLREVKSIITYYHRIKEITQKQTQLIAQYNQAWRMIQADRHFTPKEISTMAGVYSGILEATLQNVNQLFTVINSFITQMSDAKRLELINQVASTVDTNYGDLLQFNNQNAMLSLSRTRDQNDAAMVKWMYGLQP